MSRNWLIGVALVVTVSLSALAFSGVGGNLVYYWSPSEMIAAGDKAIGATIRLGGVVEGIRPEGTTIHFVVSDGTNKVQVTTTSVPPQMFREGIGVVVEGTKNPDGTFVSERLMVKHDEQYRAPKAGEKPSLATLE